MSPLNHVFFLLDYLLRCLLSFHQNHWSETPFYQEVISRKVEQRLFTNELFLFVFWILVLDFLDLCFQACLHENSQACWVMREILWDDDWSIWWSGDPQFSEHFANWKITYFHRKITNFHTEIYGYIFFLNGTLAIALLNYERVQSIATVLVFMSHMAVQ